MPCVSLRCVARGIAPPTATSSSRCCQPHTLGLGPEVWRVLARAHDLRNRGEYEGALDVDEQLIADLITSCKRVASALGKLLG